jgi:hypothetical protein
MISWKLQWAEREARMRGKINTYRIFDGETSSKVIALRSGRIILSWIFENQDT